MPVSERTRDDIVVQRVIDSHHTVQWAPFDARVRAVEEARAAGVCDEWGTFPLRQALVDLASWAAELADDLPAPSTCRPDPRGRRCVD